MVVSGAGGEPSSLLDWVTGLATDPALRTRFAEEPRSVLDEQGLSDLPPADLHPSLPLVTDSVAARLGTDVAVPPAVGLSAQLDGEDPVAALVRQFGAVTDTVSAAVDLTTLDDLDGPDDLDDTADDPADLEDPADLDGFDDPGDLDDPGDPGDLDDVGEPGPPSAGASTPGHEGHDLDDLDGPVSDPGTVAASAPHPVFGSPVAGAAPEDGPGSASDQPHRREPHNEDPDNDDADDSDRDGSDGPEDPDDGEPVETVPPEPDHDPSDSGDLDGDPDTGDPEPDLDLD